MAESGAISQADVGKLSLSFQNLDASSHGPCRSKFGGPVADGDAFMNKGPVPVPYNEDSKANSKQTVTSTPADFSSISRGPVAGGVASTDEGLRCNVCSKEHPLCDVCYKVHHYEYCPYFHSIPRGANFAPGHEIICGCGNIFNEQKWACTFCGGSIPVLTAKYCTICRSWKKHSSYECPMDEARAAMYKSDRDEQLSAVRKRIPYVSKPSSGKKCVPTTGIVHE